MDIVGVMDPGSMAAGTAGVPSLSLLYFAVQVGFASPSRAADTAVVDKPVRRCVCN